MGISLTAFAISSFILFYNHLRFTFLSKSNRPRAACTASGSIPSVDSQSEYKATGLHAIAEAEMDVIRRTVEEDDLLNIQGDHGVNKSQGRNVHLEIPNEDDLVMKNDTTIWMIFMAGSFVKKDLFNVVGSSIILMELVNHFVASMNEPGSNWLILVLASWASAKCAFPPRTFTNEENKLCYQGWIVFLTICKLSISFETKLNRLQLPSSSHQLSAYYTTLEMHIIPFYLVYTVISFFNTRSAILDYFDGPISPEAFAREMVIFAVSSLLTTVEITASRPSRFASRSSSSTTAGRLPIAPEIHASIYSLATFSFVNLFMCRAAFDKDQAYSMDIVPGAL
jgi:hypothetical protein